MAKLPDDMKDVLAEDLGGKYRELFDQFVAFGVSEDQALLAVLALADRYSGDTLYVPMRDLITRPSRDRAIIEKHDGTNVRQLALFENLTTNRVRQILQKDRDDNRGLKSSV